VIETTDSRTRLRMLGQLDLGAWVEAALGHTNMWSIQKNIATAASTRRARVAVSSCNASGKTWLAARLVLAFYDAFTPGTPCQQCDPDGSLGGCRGAKILTTSSQFEHLRDNLWGEMRIALAELGDRGIQLAGKMSLGQNLRMESSAGNHFIVGRSPNKAEGFQGFHAAHKLILGDEATSLDDQMQQGITGLLATGDSRLVLIFNPTTDDTYACREYKAPRTTSIKITAYDTPHFTGEFVPPGSNLTTPEWLEELQEKGMGPGTYEWTTRVLADFWTQGDDVLIPGDLYDTAAATEYQEGGTRALGVDLAPYGSDENTIAYRDSNALVRLSAYPAMRTDLFFESAVADAVRAFDPHYLIWDADGVGAGAYGYAEAIMEEHNRNGGNLVLLPFRGGVSVTTKFANARAAWWWSLRRRFQMGTIAFTLPPDDKLRAQVTDIRYTITDSGDIKVEPKKEMKKRGTESPDRGDAVMYAFSMVEELPIPTRVVHTPVADQFSLKDRSEKAMWEKDLAALKGKGHTRQTPWDRLAPSAQAWDDW
jgi:phage terminase large subunit